MLDIAETIERLVTQDGFEFVVCEMKGAGRRRLLRVVVDHPAGVTLEQCAALSRRIGDHLDAIDAVPTAYTLEVSSPGVERGLYRLADYQRFAGRRIRLRTTTAVHGKRLWRGRLQAVHADDAPFIVLVNDAGLEMRFPLSAIEQAQLEVSAEELFRMAEEKRAARKAVTPVS
ncbi:MAG: ribosome maturation factor RimP [Chloracidobacterium sp.]|nr:ribosome maturation factor RimP [Chloracidobacterium sp.]MDW8216384.1 ribosome maturation factor RimP [Acidobacteriota bacterium]